MSCQSSTSAHQRAWACRSSQSITVEYHFSAIALTLARAGPGQCLLGLLGKGGNNFGGRRHLRNEVNGLASPHWIRQQLATGDSILIGLPGGRVGSKLVLAASPFVKEAVPKSARTVPRRPRSAPGDIRHRAPLSVFTTTLENRLGSPGGYQRFSRHQEPGSQQCSRCSQRECGGDAATIGDPAGGQYRCGSCQVNNNRHERQRRAPATMAARLSALRDYEVGADVDRLPGLGEVSDLDDQC